MPIAYYTRTVEAWPKHMHALVPAAVLAASAAFQKTVDDLNEAERALLSRRGEAEAVQAADRGAAVAAVSVGKPPPASGVPAAFEAVEQAVRVVQARTDLARDAQNVFVAAQLAHLAETAANVRKRQGAIAATLDHLLTEVASGLNELGNLGHVLKELEGGVLKHKRTPSFRPARATARRPRDLGAEAVEPLREQLAAQVPGDTILAGAAAA